uniref:Chemosensory protein 1 n=1 Tax=Dastarcus helophoroides TaxID=1169899 RepID=A0A1I9HZQ6_9CUCU|nr:chemosensory protein 1 [Dastarcus helophoroides]
MRRVVAFVFLVTFIYANEQPKYTTKYDNIDLEEIVTNDRLLKNYVYCLLDKGPCTSDGQELKRNMPDAIKTDCAKCSEKQRTGSEYIMKYLIDHKPEYWMPLEEKYDPEGSYKKKYLESKKKNEKETF